jgi:Raf kinase inhibitor-like YbhB/YbcL family protein
MMKHALLALALVAASACTTQGSGDGSPHDATASPPKARLSVSSDELTENKPIPASHACTDYDHLGSSPQLAWSGEPEGTQSIAVTAIDPDAKGFVHWAVIGIPPSTRSLPSGASPGGAMPPGAAELTNGFGKPGYGGPCPPAGAPHHYVFTVYALRRPVQATHADKAFLQNLDESSSATGSITVTHKR